MPTAPTAVLPPASAATAPAAPTKVLREVAGGNGFIYLTTNQGGNRDITFALPEAYGPLDVRFDLVPHNDPSAGAVIYANGILYFYLPQAGPPGSAVPHRDADYFINLPFINLPIGAAVPPGWPLIRTRAPGSDGSGILGPQAQASLTGSRPAAPARLLPPTGTGSTPASPPLVLPTSSSSAPPLAPRAVLGYTPLLLLNSQNLPLLNTNNTPLSPTQE